MPKNYLVKEPFDPTPYAQRVEELLAKMTVEEKVGQLNLETLDACTALTDGNAGADGDQSKKYNKISRGQVGAILYCGLNALNNAQRMAVEETRLGIPLLTGYDVIHGHFLVSPVPLGQAAQWETDIVERCERVAAMEAYANGLNWVYAPMIDLCRDPRWGRVAEGAGEDPLLGSLIAQAKVRGLQTINPETGYPYVGACAKHYCGYGLSQGGRDYEECDISPRNLMMEYMKPYKAAVDAGALSFMSSFNVLNGEPVSGSHYYLTEILREKYGFGGFVVSDYDAVKELEHHGVAANRKECARRSVTAGVDMDMGAGCFIEHGVALYNEDPKAAAAIDEAVRRILTVKFALGLFEHPYRVESPHLINSEESRATMLESSRKCMTLLKNADNTLPLDKKKKYFLTGPLAADNRNISGCWATCAPFTNPVSVKQAFDDAGINYEYFDAIPFVERYQSFHITDESNFAKALEIAADCDEIIYVCGELASWSGENRGRVDIDLPPIQNKYLDALKSSGKKVTSVLMTGRAMSVAHLDKMSDALLLAWHAGTFTGTAVVDILFGDYNPSGRLPITFPYYTGQIPIYHSILSSGRSRESLIRYKDGENKPLYPFGYGLSYSELSYSDIAIETPVIKAGDTIRASVTVTNSSDRDADEVVQAYYCDVVSSLATPERKLCGFDKVTVPANSSVKVTLEIPSERIALMTKDLVEVIEPGEFVLYIGHDSICTDSVSFVVEE